MEEKKEFVQEAKVLGRRVSAKRTFFIFLACLLLFQNIQLCAQLNKLKSAQSAMRAAMSQADKERVRAVDLNEKLQADLVSDQALLKRLELQRKGAVPE